jgi:tight adherence protein C
MSIDYFLPLLLVLLSFSCFAGFVGVVIKTNSVDLENESWRDPAPFLFWIIRPLVRIYGPSVRRLVSDTYLRRLRNRLSSGGIEYAILPEEFITLKLVYISISILGLTLSHYFYSLAGVHLIFVGILLILMSYFVPDIWIRDRIKARKRKVEKEFPYFMDLQVLTMRAGLNYSASLSESVERMPVGPVKEEFSRLLREVRAGRPRREALLDLAARMDDTGVSNFVSAVNQAEETGGEISEVLIAQATQWRSARFRAAEEQANRAPVKMILPMIILLLPIMLILIGFLVAAKMSDQGILPDVLARLL